MPRKGIAERDMKARGLIKEDAEDRALEQRLIKTANPLQQENRKNAGVLRGSTANGKEGMSVFLLIKSLNLL